MEPRTKTTVQELNVGDRFYKCNDKNKIVLEKVAVLITKNSCMPYVHFAKHPDELHPIPLNGNTEVVFLRSVNDHEKNTESDR